MPHQLRPEDSPKDLVDYDSRRTYASNHAPILRVVDALTSDAALASTGVQEKVPLHSESETPVVTVLDTLNTDTTQHNEGSPAKNKRF